MADSLPIARRGLMFVLSAPSGTGKTSLGRRLLLEDHNLNLSISATTRPRRTGETDGRDYHFVDRPTFRQMIKDGVFVEHAHVFDHLYGTLRRPVEDALNQGRDILFIIDWQGARSLAAFAPNDIVRVFLLPPSTGELERRLRARGRDPEDVVAGRMAQSLGEAGHYDEYDYVVVNADFEASLASLRAILSAERLRRGRQHGLQAFVGDLHAGC